MHIFTIMNVIEYNLIKKDMFIVNLNVEINYSTYAFQPH